jgi:hypothetical protein
MPDLNPPLPLVLTLIDILVTLPRFEPAGGEVVAYHLKGPSLLILLFTLVLILRGAGQVRQGGCELGMEGLVHQFCPASSARCSTTI